MATTPTPAAPAAPKLTPRLEVGANLLKWGQLIKSWATGLDYVNPPTDHHPPRKDWVPASKWRPATAASFAPPSAVIEPQDTPIPAAAPWALPAQVAPVTVAGVDALNGNTPINATLPLAVALTAADFAKRMTDAGAVPTQFPPQYDHVIVVQGDDRTMIIRLPPKDTLQGSEDDLLVSGLPYPMQPFYGALYGVAPTVPKMPAAAWSAPATLAQRGAIMELHANRIGEYTLNNCN